MTTDRRKLNPQELAECSSLKAEIAAHNARAQPGKRLTQEGLAQELGMTQGNLSSHLNGKRAISKEMAAKAAMLLGIQVDKFSNRLAAEIAEMAMAVSQPVGRVAAEQSGSYVAGKAAELMGLATPRSRAVIQRINQAAIDGRLSEADLDLLDQIATRFESSGHPPAQGGQGSHKRLRDKLQNDDPHPQK